MSGIRKEVQIGDCRLILGDCLEILPDLEKVDAVVTDPPYGIRADEAAAKNKGKWGWKYYGATEWDRKRPEKPVFDLFIRLSKEQIIWGGNYFTDYVPPRMRWLMWDKGQRDFSLADFELAWTSQDKAARAFSYSRGKALQDGKTHPTQKPIELMSWCLSLLEGGAPCSTHSWAPEPRASLASRPVATSSALSASQPISTSPANASEKPTANQTYSSKLRSLSQSRRPCFDRAHFRKAVRGGSGKATQDQQVP